MRVGVIKLNPNWHYVVILRLGPDYTQVRVREA